MYLELTDEQAFLVEAATDALSRQDMLAAARGALDGDSPVDLWPVALEAGWTGLLSHESVDGAELGAYEAMLVLEACGSRLADARLLGHLPAVALLEASDFEDLELRRALATGERRAALVDMVLDGAAEFVIDAPGADVLVVVSDGLATVLDADSSGVEITPKPAYDATRSLATVRLEGAPARTLPLGPEQVGIGLALQRALLAAESVGAGESCMMMARDYAIERHAFGRPIGSYQALKHKLVEMLRLLESGRSLLVQAGRAWDAGPADAFALQANAARVLSTAALDYAAPENIFIHGGIGATWEHDAQLYYRRAELSRRLAGGAEAAADAVAELLLTPAGV
jgi:alkylation response protein AidB-like acyl-CoA dehydrogenase